MSLPNQTDELASLLAQRLEAALTASQDPAERSRLVLQVVQLGERLAIRPLRLHVLGLLREGRGGSLAELLEHVEGRYQAFREALKGKRKRRTTATDDFMTPGEAAAYLGVSPKTIAKWCDAGKLPCVVLDSGHRRIPAAALAPHKAKLAALEAVEATMSEFGLQLTDAEVAEEMLAHDDGLP